MISLNYRDSRPIYEQIKDGLRKLIVTGALGTGEKRPAPPMKKIRRATPKKERPPYEAYVCSGCGYEYDPALGDPVGGVAPGTLFPRLPEDWSCPRCAERKEHFVEA